MSKDINLSVSMDKDFLDNFHLVVEEKTGNNNMLKFYCPLIDSNELNYDGLIISLRDAAAHYCLSRRTWDEYKNRPMQLSHLVREKFRAIEVNKGELGEMLLYSFLETDLNAPKLLTKMELKTNSNMYFNGADGVHYLKLSNGDYQLIFGESKSYNDLMSGITAALDSIDKFKNDAIKDDASGELKGITFEKGLLNAYIVNEVNSEEDKKLLKSLIYPKANQFIVDTAFAVFVMYNITIDDNDRNLSNHDFRNKVFSDIKECVLNIIPNISEKIRRRKLFGHVFYFYIVPLEKMDINIKTILEGVVN